jgi:predicted transcriptional regulator
MAGGRRRSGGGAAVVRRAKHLNSQTAYYDAVVKRRGSSVQAEQLSVGFEGLDALTAEHEPSDTMRQIVSLRMPDALLDRVERTARARGVSPSSLMRALIAAGLDRSYAAVAEPSDLAAEVARLRRSVEHIAERLDVMTAAGAKAETPIAGANGEGG